MSRRMGTWNRWTWLAVFLAGAMRLCADDWPQWLGPQRDGVWRESGILDHFATNGLPVRWRVPVNPGYVGPAVAQGRLYLLDRVAGKALERKPGTPVSTAIPGHERVLCLDARTGTSLWEHAYSCDYRIAYPSGPRATPIVAAGRVYTLGAMGDLQCLDAATGRVIWAHSFPKDFRLDEPPLWGWSANPILEGRHLICLVGGPGSGVVAFDRDTGAEVWRALTTQEIGYAPLMAYEIGGRRQLVVWHPEAVCGLDPTTGKVLWTQPYPVGEKAQRPEVTVATPRWDGRHLFVTSFYHGSLMLQPTASDVRVVWNRRSSKNSEMDAGLHTVMCTPVFRAGFIYGVCGFGELRCLEAATGDRKWETYAATGGKPGLFANAFLVEQGNRCWLWNDQGELILAQLTPEGYREISRAKLLDTVENARGRDVLWCHPAFANRHAYVHNGRELICVSLAAPGG